MKYGFWLPVFGGWLRNVEEEGMEASWDYLSQLARKAEDFGYDLTLIAELMMNDIKGMTAPSFDAWSTAAALAAVTRKLELLVAVRPSFHQPGPFAKQAATIDRIAGGRLSLNVVSSWWKSEAERFGLTFDEHDDRYSRTREWLTILEKAWREREAFHEGPYYQTKGLVVEPKPLQVQGPKIYAGGESEAAKNLIAEKAQVYVMHGDTPEKLRPKIEDMKRRREAFGLEPLQFGVAAYSLVRNTEAEVARELERITDVSSNSAAYATYRDFVQHSQLESNVSLEDYSVSNRGLRTGLVGTPAAVIDRLGALREVGVDLLLLQCSPQLEEMERFASEVMRKF